MHGKSVRKWVVAAVTMMAAASFAIVSAGSVSAAPVGSQSRIRHTAILNDPLVHTQLPITLIPISAPVGTPVSIGVTFFADSYPVVPPGGTITVSVSGTDICSFAPWNGHPCIVSNPPIGRDEVDANYSGDIAYAPTASASYLYVTNPNPSVTCAKVSGNYFTRPIVFANCSPSMGKFNKKAKSEQTLQNGLTLVWSRTGGRTIIPQRIDGRGQGSCKAKSVELDVYGVVTGGTSTYTHLYDPVFFRLCRSPGFNLSLVPGTVAEL